MQTRAAKSVEKNLRQHAKADTLTAAAGQDDTPAWIADPAAIFSEAGVSPQLAETIAKETGAKVITDLPTDSLLDKPADSYLGLMRVVVDKIVAALK